ncbi:MAG: ABC transporter permease [Candidatus Thermoplasmatota archaeon]|nr:ABC transporter permease [Candidatus Thermoplasmatota archaeon]
MFENKELIVRKSENSRFHSFILTIKLLVKTPTGLAGFIIMLFYFGTAIFMQFGSGLIGITDPGYMPPNFSNPYPVPPSHEYLFGTTYPGINLFPAVFKAIRIDVFSAVAIVGAGALIGILIGVISGYKGKGTDQVVMRVTDIFFSLPFLVLAMAIGFVLGRALNDIILALIIVWWPIYARLTRGQVLYLKNELYVRYSQLSGNSTMKTLFKHIIPNTLTPVLVQMSIDMANVILAIAGLYFIGFAATSPYLPELGSLISYGFPFVLTAPWTILYPGLFLMVFALGMNLFGDGLRDALNPKFRT